MSKSKTKFVVIETESKHNEWLFQESNTSTYVNGVYDSRHEAVRSAEKRCKSAMSYDDIRDREVATSLVLDEPEHKIIMTMIGRKLNNGSYSVSSSMTTIRVVER